MEWVIGDLTKSELQHTLWTGVLANQIISSPLFPGSGKGEGRMGRMAEEETG